MSTQSPIAQRREIQKKIWTLLGLSEKYRRQAKAVSASVRSKRGCYRYYKLINLSIKCLRLTLSKYIDHLEPKQKSLQQFKLGVIYYEDTHDYALAESYLGNAIQFMTKYHFDDYLIPAQILLVKAQAKSNRLLAQSRLRKFLDYHSSNPDRFSYFHLLSHQLFNDWMRRILWTTADAQRVNKSTAPARLYTTISYCLILLTRGDRRRFQEVYTGVDVTGFKEKQVPVQLQLMYYMLGMYFHLLEGNMLEIKHTTSQIDQIIRTEKERKWDSWTVNGDIILGDRHGSSSQYKVTWLTKPAFLSLYRTLVAIALTNQGKHSVATTFFKAGMNRSSLFLHALGTKNYAFQGSLKQLNSLYESSGSLLFNTLYYSELVSSLLSGESYTFQLKGRPVKGQSPWQFSVFSDDEPSERGLASRTKKLYHRKISYFNGLVHASKNDLAKAFECFLTLSRDNTLLDDLALFSVMQQACILSWLSTHSGGNPGYSDRVRKGAKKQFNYLRSSLTKAMGPAGNTVNGFQFMFKQNPELMTLLPLLELSINFSAPQGQDMTQFDSPQVQKLSTPFTKILSSLICSFHARSTTVSRAKLDYCLSIAEGMSMNYDEVVMKSVIYKTELHFLEKSGSAAEIEVVKLKLMNLKKSVADRPFLSKIVDEKH